MGINMNTADITCDIISEQTNNNKKQTNDWYNRVYLCIERKESRNYQSSIISGFKCWRFDTFEKADESFSKVFNNKHEILDVRHTMVPICKWVPKIFDKYILNWKLRNIYWKGNHIVYRGGKL